MKVEYNKTIEVTGTQYNYLIKEFAGVIAHRQEAGKYYIRVWQMRCAKQIEAYLKKTESKLLT